MSVIKELPRVPLVNIIQDMTREELLNRMFLAADIQLHMSLTDIDPFWIRWNYMKEELNKKEML